MRHRSRMPWSRTDQEYHTSYWGHLGLLDISGGVILPGYVGYPNTAASQHVSDECGRGRHRARSVVPWSAMCILSTITRNRSPSRAEPLSNELPVDVALGKVDYMEILGFSDHRTHCASLVSAPNLGFRIPAAGRYRCDGRLFLIARTVGMNRVYAQVAEGELKPQEWMASLKAGRSLRDQRPVARLHVGRRRRRR